MKALLATVAFAALAGCASAPWTRAGSTGADFERDKAQCSYEADVATAPIHNPIEAGTKAGFMQVACLQARGWHK